MNNLKKSVLALKLTNSINILVSGIILFFGFTYQHIFAVIISFACLSLGLLVNEGLFTMTLEEMKR